MAGDRIRRYAWQRTGRPRNWNPHMFGGAASASHTAPKTGGYRAVRHQIHELRAREAAVMDLTLTVNGKESDYDEYC